MSDSRDFVPFAICISGMYRQSLPPVQDWERAYTFRQLDPYLDNFTALIKVYILALKLRAQTLKEAVVQLAVDYFRSQLPAHGAIYEAIKMLPGESPFLRLLVDVYLLRWSSSTLEGHSEAFVVIPGQLYKRLVQKYRTMLKADTGSSN